MRVIFCGQVTKDPSYPEANEDAYAIVRNTGRVAISDGASESFDSKTWAKLLVDAFTKSPELNHSWLSTVVRQYNESYDLSKLSWSKYAAFERGSFATLLGIEKFSEQSVIRVQSVGDSLAVLLSGSKVVCSFPYKKASQFQCRPDLFSTSALHNGFFYEADFFSRHFKTWDLRKLEDPFLLCMTDALGEWALKM